MNFATLFSGGELFGVGARQAGLIHAWGVEIDPKIAAVAQANDFDVHCGDAYFFSPPPVDLFLLHASPPCQRASIANPINWEEFTDLRLAQATTLIVAELMPQFFTLENVINYRNFNAFEHICESLSDLDYSFDYWNLNMADFGIPQTRKRLILIARRDGKRIRRIEATHKQHPDMFAKRWVSWGEALQGKIKDLPDTTLSKKQIKKISERIPFDTLGFVTDTQNTNRKNTIRLWGQPFFTATAHTTKGYAKGRLPCGRLFRMNQAGYAAIQTVPDDYVFKGTKRTIQKVIGNGVPPLFAKRLCKHLLTIK